MDDFTNYVLSFLLALAVWGVGALYIRSNENTSLAYVKWLKVWAITAVFQTVIFSLLLGLLFPAPEVKSVESDISSSLTNPENQLSPDVQQELQQAGD